MGGNGRERWTFATRRSIAFEPAQCWQVVADNFQFWIWGDGLSDAALHAAVADMGRPGFREKAEGPHAHLARLPAYRLSKLQSPSPEELALEVVGRHLLDFEAAWRSVASASGLQRAVERNRGRAYTD